MLSWLIFKNYLLSRRSGALVRIIAWHCILGIGMGVAALIIVLSVMNGFNLTIRNRMLSIVPHLIVLQNALPTAIEQQKFTAMLKKISVVEQIDRFASMDLILRSMDGTFGGAMAKGYDTKALDSLLTRVWKSTRHDVTEPPRRQTRLEPNEIILGVDLARSLGVYEGDEVILLPPEVLLLPKGEMPRFQKFKVQSLISTQMPEVDAKLMFYNMDVSGGLLKSLSMETGFEIRLQDPYVADSVKRQMVAQGYNIQTWTERDTSLFFALKMESFAMALFLSLAMLITSFSIVTVMVLLMSQKRRDIGMVRALGLSLKKTRLVFLRVGLMLSCCGILGGLILGSSICLFLDLYPMELLPDIYTDSTLPAKMTWRILLFVVGTSAVIACLGSWLPVWSYVSESPAESLRKPVGAN